MFMTSSNQEVMEVLTGPERRQRWSVEEKLAMVRESFEPGKTVSDGGTPARGESESGVPVAQVVPGREPVGGECRRGSGASLGAGRSTQASP
uniref:Transposase n=1 Tax=blood disease bacterium R229 TaxID=741978 RepID=G2ZPK8_9RALS|nr:transposase [blood disease bacterium R229]